MAKTFKFYGVCGNCYKLDNTVWEAFEDESDGYRSYLGSIEQSRKEGIFFPDPVAEVEVVNVDDTEGCTFKGWELVDVDYNHVWLQVGTSNYDDYYPCFVFNYSPRPPECSKRCSWEEFIKE